MGWVWHLVCMVIMTNVYKILIWKLKGRDHVKVKHGRIMLKCRLRKQEVKGWTSSLLTRINGQWWGMEKTVISFVFHKRKQTFVASLEDLYSMESVYSIYWILNHVNNKWGYQRLNLILVIHHHLPFIRGNWMTNDYHNEDHQLTFSHCTTIT